MRAVLIKDGKGPIENLYIGETPTPSPGKGEALVKVKAFGLNRMDIIQREGNYPPPPGISEILGVEFSGHVQALGEGTSLWKEGDEVFGLAGGGAYAEYIVVKETHLIPKPERLSWVEAACIPEAFLTAFQALYLVSDFKKGENLLVHAAASGVGIAVIQLAHVTGASTITATASKKEKLDWVLGLGATHTANYKTEDFSETVKTATNGKGADVVVDFVGQSHWTKNLNSMALDGRMVMLAMLSGSVVESTNLGLILAKRLRIQGSTLRSRSAEYQGDLITRFKNEFLDKITGQEGPGPVKTFIHKVYSWRQIQEAHREMETDSNSGNIVVEID